MGRCIKRVIILVIIALFFYYFYGFNELIIMDTYWNNNKIIKTENGLCINKCVRCGGCIAVCDYNVLHK